MRRLSCGIGQSSRQCCASSHHGRLLTERLAARYSWLNCHSESSRTAATLRHWSHRLPQPQRHLAPEVRERRRSFCSSEGKGEDSAPGFQAPKEPLDSKRGQPVDTSTVFSQHRDSRHVERRIEEHVRKIELRKADSEAPSSEAAEAAASRILDQKQAGEADQVGSVPMDGSAEVPATTTSTAPTAHKPLPEALRILDPDAPGDADAGKEVIVRSRTTTGQVLWPATPEDIEILSSSKLMYPAPYEVEGSVIIRLVRLSDPVTSPVGRVMRNRQFGIRGNEKWQLLAMGCLATCFIYSLGFWQLRRMEWKKHLIEMRRERLSMPRLQVKGSPFPWTDQVEDYVYRLVEIRGVFDHRREMLIGPRPGMDDTGATNSGYLVVTPLRLEDGSTVLVNRGHIDGARADPVTRPEVPTWVRLRGILEEGEIPNMVADYARLKNRPDRGLFVYLIAEDLAEQSGARNHKECQQALITATDLLYEDDFKAGVRREMPFVMRHKEDYLCFWADEHTHFNYACQWFSMGTLFLAMTVYKFIEVTRWRF